MIDLWIGDQFPFSSFDADRCYRGDAFDSEDVFQATNLVLLQKAGAPGLCGQDSWSYPTASSLDVGLIPVLHLTVCRRTELLHPSAHWSGQRLAPGTVPECSSRSRLPRDQRSTTESTEIHGKENPNQLPLSVSFPGVTPARRVGSFRGYPLCDDLFLPG